MKFDYYLSLSKSEVRSGKFDQNCLPCIVLLKLLSHTDPAIETKWLIAAAFRTLEVLSKLPWLSEKQCDLVEGAHIFLHEQMDKLTEIGGDDSESFVDTAKKYLEEEFPLSRFGLSEEDDEEDEEEEDDEEDEDDEDDEDNGDADDDCGCAFDDEKIDIDFLDSLFPS